MRQHDRRIDSSRLRQEAEGSGTDADRRHGTTWPSRPCPIVKDKVLAVSAATIDRMLAGTRLQIDGQRKRGKGIGAAIRRSIPLRTFADWGD